METSDNKPLFTLSAEEVEIAEVVFSRFILDRPDLRKFIVENNREFNIINNIITRIKQWQDDRKDNQSPL